MRVGLLGFVKEPLHEADRLNKRRKLNFLDAKKRCKVSEAAATILNIFKIIFENSLLNGQLRVGELLALTLKMILTLKKQPIDSQTRNSF